MLIQLSSTKCSIKYCTQCLQYFLDIPSLKHNHSDYIEEMIKKLLIFESYPKIFIITLFLLAFFEVIFIDRIYSGVSSFILP